MNKMNPTEAVLIGTTLKQLPADTQLDPRLEKTYAITLTESELTIAVTALWYLGRAEREHTRQVEAKFGQVATNGSSATEALADRLAKQAKAP
jgi:hypothetical protein